MFADIDAFLRPMGFRLFAMDLSNGVGRLTSPVDLNKVLPGPTSKGQVCTSDALYMCDPLARGAEMPSAARLLKLAVFAERFGRVEFAFEMLSLAGSRLEREGDTDAARAVRAALEATQDAYLGLCSSGK